MAINDQLGKIVETLNLMLPKRMRQESLRYGLDIEDRVQHISTMLDDIAQNGGLGITCHVCASDEYDHITFVPTIEDPDEGVVYLTPSGNTPTNSFNEYFYVDDSWELFGSATIAMEQVNWNETDTTAQTYILNKPSIKAGSGSKSIIEGAATTASGPQSHAEGSSTYALGINSHAEGVGSQASGEASHAEGSNTKASNSEAHAEGLSTLASGYFSHAEGKTSTASGNTSHSEGSFAVASGDSSHAQGYGTVANHAYQYAAGQYNVADVSSAAATQRGNYIEIIGNGTNENSRSNARTLDWSGNEWLAGSLTLGETTLSENTLKALIALLS